MSASESGAERYPGRPSVCRNCGALVGAGERSCAQCGAQLSAPTAEAGARRRPAYDRETMIFARAILTRPATFTIIFLIANLLFFLLMTFSGGADGGTLIAYGAKLNSLINEQRQWWRFVTPIFLHIRLPGFGPMHILVNMYGLWMIGPYVERLYGSAKFVVFWIVTGIAGVAASYLTVRPGMNVGTLASFLFKNADGPSAGASGALFGLIGVLFVFGLKFRHELPEGFKRAFGVGMLPTIFINLFIGFIARGYIDNAAHLGGLLAGAALALLVGYKRPGARGKVTIFWHILQVCALALVCVSFFMVWRHYDGPRLELSFASLQRGLFGGGASTAHIEAINAGIHAFAKAFNEGDASEVDSAVQTINNVPSLDKQADALREELKGLLERAREQAAAEPGDKPRPSAKRAQLLKDFQSWEEENRQWVKTKGGIYGVEWVEDKETGSQESQPAASPKQ
jgi:membrane associated rhomboid family serine protease